MNNQKNIIVAGKHDKPITLDVYWHNDKENQPVIIFAHGFKGFKDWGHWEAIGEKFVAAGYCFIKFNFSHNGVTPDDLLNFADLEAFGDNNYSKELDDLQTVIDWLSNPKGLDQNPPWNIEDLTLIGHSRGGPIALISAKENEQVKRVITWAGVHELNYSWQNKPLQIAQWQQDRVIYILNGRTKQQMPLFYQLYEDYQNNKKRFSVKNTLEALQKPYLIVQGSDDPAIPMASAEYLKKQSSEATLEVIEGANHVFDGNHPFEADELPEASQELVNKTLNFIEKTP